MPIFLFTENSYLVVPFPPISLYGTPGKIDELKAVCDKYGALLVAKGSYVAGDFNAYYVREKPEYRIVNKPTDYLLYGFDDEEKSFFALGNSRNDFFTSFRLSYSEYADSIFHREDNKFNLNYYSINKNLHPQISLINVYKSLNDYISSSCSNIERYSSGALYGVKVWDNLKRDLFGSVNIDTYLDMRSLMVYNEHKRIMRIRANGLKSAYASFPNSIVEGMNSNAQQASMCLNACIEYNKTQKYKLLSVIDSAMRKISEDESILLIDMLEWIQKQVIG